MKKQISLKWFVALSFLALAAMLVIGYSLLSVYFFTRGMDSAAGTNMDQAVKSYAASIPAEQQERLNTFSGYQIAKHWRQMPENIRRGFQEPDRPGIMLKNNVGGKWFLPPKEVLFVMRVVKGGETYFISSRTTLETVSEMIADTADENIQILLVLIVAIAVTMSGIIWLLIRKVEGPVNALGGWARTLNKDNLDQTPPDFFYPELNELAEMIRSSLSSVQKSLDREYRFLRHSSHELRTPISVIRNNVELIRRLQQSGRQALDPRQEQIVERIDRASRTMKNLTETLLWLSRESEEELPEEEVDVETIIHGLIRENDYLLKDKNVKLMVETASCIVMVPEVPFRIVLGNLIRNAFQHTWRGTVAIVQKGDSVEISNDLVGETEESRDLGFGLGLQLTEQLTRKLNWPYTSGAESGRHMARLSLHSDT